MRPARLQSRKPITDSRIKAATSARPRARFNLWRGLWENDEKQRATHAQQGGQIARRLGKNRRDCPYVNGCKAFHYQVAPKSVTENPKDPCIG